MTAAIVVYVLIVTLPFVAAAALTEKIFRLWSWPVRGIWAVTALLIVSFGGRAVVQQSSAAPAVPIGSIHTARVTYQVAAGSAVGIEQTVDRVTAFPRSAAAYVAHELGPVPNQALAVLWCVMTVAMLMLVCLVYARVWRIRSGWKMAEFAGQHVRVSPHVGPAVIGLIRPEIVVPRWMLDSDADANHLVVMHEKEHRDAHDPLLLAAMWALVALIPWHPGAWYCLARTRLAIELDCDARVVKRGASLRTYAQLLVQQARVRLNAPSHIWLGATSLLEPSSHLERRLNAMIRPDMNSRLQRPVARYLRSLSCLAIVSTLAVAACESHVPTADDITGLDAASAEKNARYVSIFDKQPVTYYVDEIKVSADSAHAISAADISAITVSKQGPQQTVRMVTMPDMARIGHPSDTSADSLSTKRHGPTFTVHVVKRVGAIGQSDTVVHHNQPFSGAVIIDGVSADLAAMQSLNPSQIATVEVIKGAAAMQQTADPRAKDGVILITLKH